MRSELQMERLHVTLLFEEGSLGEFGCFEEVTQGRTELVHWLSLPSPCGKTPPALHAAIPPQCHRNQSSWHDHVCQVTLDCATQPKRCPKMWRTCMNYKGKHLKAVLYSRFDLLREEGVSFGSKQLFWLHKCATYADKRSFPVKVLILPTFTIYCIHIQPVHDPCWLPSIPTHLSVFPANGQWFSFFFPLKNAHYHHAFLCFTCWFKMVITDLQTSHWSRPKQRLVYLKETLGCSSR